MESDRKFKFDLFIVKARAHSRIAADRCGRRAACAMSAVARAATSGYVRDCICMLFVKTGDRLFEFRMDV